MSATCKKDTYSKRNPGRNLGSSYLAVILAGIILSPLANFLWPMTPVFKGQGLEILIPFIFAFAGFLLWLIFDTNRNWDKKTRIFLSIVAVYWMYARILDASQNDGVNYNSLIVPLLVLLVYLKPLNRTQMFRTMDAFSFMVIGAALVGQFAVMLGIVNPRTEFIHRIPIFPALGFDWRWEGIFGNVNYSGPVGAFLLVYGLGRGRVQGFLVAAAGLTFLFASESRGALVAGFFGSVILLMFKQRWGRFEIGIRARLALGFALILIPIAGSLASDPTGNGRLTVWRDFITVWPKSPMTGVSQAQITAYIENGNLSVFSTHGHNVLVQSLVTQGLIGLLLLIALLVVGCTQTFSGISRNISVAFAVFITMIVCNLDEDLFDGNYLSIQYLSLVLPVLLAARVQNRDSPEQVFVTQETVEVQKGL